MLMTETLVEAPPVSVQYNVGSASAVRVKRDIVRLITKVKPDFIGFNEVGDRGDLLEEISRETGWPLIRIDDRSLPSSGHVAALISPECHLDAKPTIEQISPPGVKVGKNTAGARRDGKAEAKYILKVMLTVRGYSETFGVWHAVPSAMKRLNFRTRRLHRKQMRAGAAWLRREIAAAKQEGKDRQVTLQGDVNAALNIVRERRLLKPLMRVKGVRLFGAASHVRRWIDVFASTALGVVEALEGYSSDHRPVVFRMRRRRTTVAHRWEPDKN